MNQDHLKAVTFANSYFALADGLVSGIEHFLAENVLLDWFGKTIKGRHNVAAFLSTHKVNSRHVFNDITSCDSIGYNKKSHRRRRRHKAKISNSPVQNANISFEKHLIGQSTPLSTSISSNEKSHSWTKSYCSTEEENDFTLELHDNSLSNIFKLENVKSTDIQEIEQQIRQISLEDKLNIVSQKRNCQVPRETRNVSIVEPSMQFMEAYGEILFSKRSKRLSGRNDYKLIPPSSTQTWRKPCKLQIAYSLQPVYLQPKLSTNNNHFVTDHGVVRNENQTETLDIERIIDVSNQRMTSVNDYSGYKNGDVDIDKEQSAFFQHFDECLSKEQRDNLSITPRYINNQLILQNESENNFVFNNLIHIIIYEGRSRCRTNLSQKFV